MRQLFGKNQANTAHSIIRLPIKERPKSLFPLLILADGNPSLLVAAYTRDLQRRNWSPKKIDAIVSAIGRLYDYYTFKFGGTELEPRQQRMLLSQFAEARLNGTVQSNNAVDSTGLYWQRVKYNTVKKDIDCITKFSQWLADNFEFYPINPLENKYVSCVRESYETAIKMSTDLLFHLHPTRTNKKYPQFEIHNNTGSHLTDIPKAFPANKVIELINAASNPRDKMAFILMAFGSLRISEVVHIFLEDVSTTFRDNGTAYVTLGHPEEGHYQWLSKLNKPCSGTRSEYLMEKYGRVPRNRMEGTQFYSGWKGMEFASSNNTGFVHWAREEAGIYFRKLLYQYFNEIFKGKPYLFVKTDRRSFGEPLTIANISKQFYTAVKKIGLDRRQPGVNPHGLRHFYGFYCADVLGISLRGLQHQMHHASPISTLVYHHITHETVRDSLRKAQLDDLKREHEIIGQEFKDTKIVLPNEWGPSPGDPFGLLSYFRHTGE
ncbi:MAG TPA: site-specific integrase [Pyrinomonadaceae bacterium]|jgi:integrase